MNIGENIKNKRLSLNLKQSELADKVNVSRPMITQIERGTKLPTILLAKEIATALNCDLNDLIF